MTPEMRVGLDAFRERILAGFNGHGMGRRTSEEVFELFKADIDALSDFLGEKEYFLGSKIHSIDASLYSSLRHVTDQPQQWAGTGYTDTKPNLVDYMARVRKVHGI